MLELPVHVGSIARISLAEFAISFLVCNFHKASQALAPAILNDMLGENASVYRTEATVQQPDFFHQMAMAVAVPVALSVALGLLVSVVVLHVSPRSLNIRPRLHRTAPQSDRPRATPH